MFSVNIDKLTNMTDVESKCYEEVVDVLMSKCDEQCRSIGVVGEPRSAFKLATAVAAKGRKVLFVDADISNNVFLSKYRLGKDLKGFTDYITGTSKVKELICLTNNSDVNIMFTGESDDYLAVSQYGDRIQCLIAEALDSCDMVIVASDEDGDVASFCGGTIMIVKDEDYTEEYADKKAEELENKGCVMLGVIIDEQ